MAAERSAQVLAEDNQVRSCPVEEKRLRELRRELVRVQFVRQGLRHFGSPPVGICRIGFIERDYLGSSNVNVFPPIWILY